MIALLFSVLPQLQIHNPTTFLLLLIPITNHLLLILQLTRNPTILTSLIPRNNMALSLLFLEMFFFRNNGRRSVRFQFQSSYHSWLISKQRSSLSLGRQSSSFNSYCSSSYNRHETQQFQPSKIFNKTNKTPKKLSIPKKLRISIPPDVKLSPDLQIKCDSCLLGCSTKFTNILITHHEQSLPEHSPSSLNDIPALVNIRTRNLLIFF